MSSSPPQPETPQNPAPEATKQPAEKPGFLDKLKTAWDKATEDKDKNFIEKVGIFFMSFFSDMKELTEEEKKAAQQAEEEVKKGVDETVKGAQEAAKLADTVEKSDKEFYDEVLAMGVASLKSLDKDRQTSAYKGLNKLDAAAKGGASSKLEIDEACSLAGVGFMTFKKLKRKYPKKDDFKAALDRLSTVSDSSQYPLKKLLSKSVLGIFKVDIGFSDAPEVYKFVSDFGIGLTDIPSVYSTLSGIGKNPMENEQEIVATMKRFFFPNTSEGDISSAVKLMNNLKVSGPVEVDTQTLTDLLFYINDSDHDRLVAVLTGVKGSEEEQLAKAA